MINFNVDPYYDDFDPNNHYHRILFKPGRAVQARELTQSQTILQDQISKFADHIFKQNTPVKGGQVTVNNQARYLKLNATFNDTDIVASDFLNQVIADSTGQILAKVIATEESVSTDPPTLVVTYYSGVEFAAGDVIYGETSSVVGQIVDADHTGYCTTASISEGVFYIVNGYAFSSVENEDGTFSRYSIGNFVSLQPQTIIVQKYSNTPTKRIGLSISEYISDYVTDSQLLDPAVGATNYQAPGADRYTITLTLDTKNIELGTDSGFIELVRITGGKIQKLVDGTVYGVIDDYFAKRTFDTNGDFVVNDFRVIPRANTENLANYQLSIGTGVAYVKGYRVENALEKIIEAPRARTTAAINNNFVSVNYGSYLYINRCNGVFDITTANTVDFHCVNVSSSIVTTNTTTYNATKVGTGYIRGLSFDTTNSGDANTSAYVYKAYVSDLQNSVLSSNCTSAGGTTANLQFFDLTGSFSSSANAYYGATLSITGGTSAGYSGTIVSYNGTTKTATVDKAFTVIPDSTSRFSLRFDTKDIDLMVHPTSTNNFDAFAGIDPKGKLGGLSIGQTQLYNSSSPELVFNIGYPYVDNLTDTSYGSYRTFRGVSFSTSGGGVSASISAPTNSTFFGTGGTTQDADYVKQYYTVIVTAKGSSAFNVGEIVPFTSTNTITLDAGKNGATLFVNGGAAFTATIITKIAINNAGTTGLALREKNLYEANTTNVNYTGGTAVGSINVDLNNAQVYIPKANIPAAGTKQPLYISDVKKIIKIIDTRSSANVPTDAMLSDSSYDVTSYYIFNNGQTDSYYGHSNITLRLGAPKPLGNILVLVDYYSHAGGDGYFSVNSYRSSVDGGVSTRPENYAEIPSYTSKGGLVYNLRDCMDFRPSVLNAQSAFKFRYSSTPTATNDVGLFIPIDLSEARCDNTYYLGRKDVIMLSKDKSFVLVQGKPANIPAFPAIPEGSLLMANITLDPYTSYLPDESFGSLPNLSIEKIQHKRWRMSDISDLQTRVNNIEYYTSLSLLEKQAESLQVPDSNGLNRFKNGILVDNFSSFASSDTGNEDFAAKINKRETILTATDHVLNIPLQHKDVLNSLGNLSQAAQTRLGYKYHTTSGGATGLVTLPYTTANLVVQKLASGTVSLNPFAVSVDEGVLEINPPIDMWVSTTKEPDILLVDPDLTIYQQGSTLNQLSATDWQAVAGTQVTDQARTGRNVVVSTYESQAKQTTSGYYDKVNSLSGTYLTDVSLQPYIRGQQLIIRANGMKSNTAVSTWFDGVSVDDYMVSPNIVEASNVSGTFKDGDIVGYMSGAAFIATGRVVSVKKLSASKVRLFLTSDNSSAVYSSSSTIRTGSFNENGTFESSAPFASGSVNLATEVVSLSGTITASGGTSANIEFGGTSYTGVTSITLNSKASSTTNFYVGSKISVTTFQMNKITTPVVVGRTPANRARLVDGRIVWGATDIIENRVSYEKGYQVYTSTITAYNGSTKVATLSTPITVSLGTNGGYAGTPPRTNIDSTYSVRGTFKVSQAVSQSKVPALSTDEDGSFTAIFSLPSNYFKTGDRMFRVDNRAVPTDPDSATTFAQSVFTASSLAVRSQTLSFGASVTAAGKSTVFTTQQQRDNQLISRYSFTIDPIAQTFIIDKDTYPNGAFIKSVKVFFKTKPASNARVPIKFFITDTTNGYPNGNALDYSVVVKNYQDVNISNTPQYLDPNTYTEFTFESPVYIRSGNLYAFILQTTSPDYTVWIAAQNAAAVASTTKNLPTDPTPTVITKIGGSPYVGALFESQNGITWTADQTKNMMFIIENCVFSTSATPAIQYVVPKKIPLRKLITSDIDYFKNANTISNIEGNFYVSDIRSDAYNLTTTDYLPTNTNISYTYTPTLQSSYLPDETKNITPGKFATSMPEHIYLDDGKGPRVLDSNSASSFTLTATLSTTDSFVSPVISDDGISLYNIKYNITNMSLSNNDISVLSGGTGYSSGTCAITISAPTGTGGTQASATANVVGGIIEDIYILNGGSGYVTTPTITITGANTGTATAEVSGETSSKGGNGWARYITKKVVLTPENDSEDLRVYYTAYKPLGSDINVYCKVLNRNDTENFNDQNWILLTNVGNKSSAYSLNRQSLYEYVAAPGSSGIADNSLTYTSTSGQSFNSFSQFAIKVVLSTKDTTKVPVLHDIRVLALPSGTGV
jgi:hypothetical protein